MSKSTIFGLCSWCFGCAALVSAYYNFYEIGEWFVLPYAICFALLILFWLREDTERIKRGGKVKEEKQ